MLLVSLLRLRPMLLFYMEDMAMVLDLDMLDLAMEPVLGTPVLAMDMVLPPPLLPDTESPMLPTL